MDKIITITAYPKVYFRFNIKIPLIILNNELFKFPVQISWKS